MERSHWNKLRRGDMLARQVGDGSIRVQIISIDYDTSGARVLSGMSPLRRLVDPSEWTHVGDNGEVLNEDGTVNHQVKMAPPLVVGQVACRMCKGNRATHDDNGAPVPCPRCAGNGGEPTDLDETIVELRIFFPKYKTDAFPFIMLNVDSAKLNPAQVISSLQNAITMISRHPQSLEMWQPGQGKPS